MSPARPVRTFPERFVYLLVASFVVAMVLRMTPWWPTSTSQLWVAWGLAGLWFAWQVWRDGTFFRPNVMRMIKRNFDPNNLAGLQERDATPLTAGLGRILAVASGFLAGCTGGLGMMLLTYAFFPTPKMTSSEVVFMTGMALLAGLIALLPLRLRGVEQG